MDRKRKKKNRYLYIYDTHLQHESRQISILSVGIRTGYCNHQTTDSYLFPSQYTVYTKHEIGSHELELEIFVQNAGIVMIHILINFKASSRSFQVFKEIQFEIYAIQVSWRSYQLTKDCKTGFLHASQNRFLSLPITKSG